MTCGNKFCIYWEQGTCELSQVSLDIQGACEDCIYISIGEQEMQAARRAARENLAQRQK